MLDVSTPKTFTQHVFRRDAVQVSAAEVSAAEEKFTFKCGYCDRKFKDTRAKKIHEASCKHYYGTTEEYYEIENITVVFGRVEARWYLVKWKGYEVPE